MSDLKDWRCPHLRQYIEQLTELRDHAKKLRNRAIRAERFMGRR